MRISVGLWILTIISTAAAPVCHLKQMAGLRRKQAKNSIRCKKLAFLLEKSSWLIRAGANLRHCCARAASGDYSQKQCTSETIKTKTTSPPSRILRIFASIVALGSGSDGRQRVQTYRWAQPGIDACCLSQLPNVHSIHNYCLAYFEAGRNYWRARVWVELSGAFHAKDASLLSEWSEPDDTRSKVSGNQCRLRSKRSLPVEAVLITASLQTL